ncbi:flagellar biosynthesis regulatory protein FlaF [Pelagivirga sediminicola]|uniref:Flagellar biosynthesis regulatory protein FlaF n=1 Tax=Pelagivirga sediminicola TaxID=2170575 RepID=A0A2T7G5K8_9RHOB|nr:flagellar biosynthesis regulator FlaF [Pelagivirga sediminicola]PVA09705.1 flagellar biosynthesis regulatory protein FlaF [Pelagivirga sediminicola]
MNAIRQAQNAYGQTNQPIRTMRGTEYETVARITHRLKSAAAKEPFDIVELATAIHENRNLWALFATEVADNDNPLPKELRAGIFSLAEFTNSHSSKVLRSEASADALIEINTAIMRGLRDGGAAA